MSVTEGEKFFEEESLHKMRDYKYITDPKKYTSQVMIEEALTELSSFDKKKGVSFYAIRKYIIEKFNVDRDRINNLLKKSIKAAVDSGAIIQTKGIGASGAFKLPPPKKVDKLKAKKRKDSKKLEAKHSAESNPAEVESSKIMKELESLEKLLADEEKANKKRAKKTSKTSLEYKIAQMNRMNVKINSDKERGDKKTESKKKKHKAEKKTIKKKKLLKEWVVHGHGEPISNKKIEPKMKPLKKQKKKSILKKRKSLGSMGTSTKMKPKQVLSFE